MARCLHVCLVCACVLFLVGVLLCLKCLHERLRACVSQLHLCVRSVHLRRLGFLCVACVRVMLIDNHLRFSYPPVTLCVQAGSAVNLLIDGLHATCREGVAARCVFCALCFMFTLYLIV